MTYEYDVNTIARAIYTVNRHAKAALKPQHLYMLKQEAIYKLLKKEKAKKIGLHFSNNPKLSNQHSILLVQVNDYYFHLIPTKEDFKTLEHLGNLDEDFRNPNTRMSLSYAKKIIYNFLDWKPKKRNITENRRTSAYYTPSSLGKMEWPPTKRFR